MNDYYNFILIFSIGLIAPGPDFLVVLKSSLNNNSAKKYFVPLGISLGCIIHATLTLVLLTFIGNYLNPLINYLKYLGGGYLFYLGITMILVKKEFSFKDNQREKSKKFFFRDGLLVNLFNPKVMIFFSSIFSFYINKQSFNFEKKALYSLTIFIMCLGWFLLVTYIFSRLKEKGNLNLYNHVINKIFGLLFIYFSFNLIVYQL